MRTTVRHVFSLVFLLAFPTALFAQTHVLSGTVYGGGAPLGSTTVEALQDGTTTIVASGSTNASGQYSLNLVDGTYDLRVTPSSGSGFGQETVQDIAMSGANRQYDVILLGAAGVLSGTVRGLGGAPVANANVNVYAAGNLLLFLGSAVTNAAGQYSIAATGPVNVSASGSLLPPPPGGGLPMPGAAPSSWSFGRNNVVVSGATTLDIDLPAVRVTGTATDSSGARVSNVRVQANNSRFEIATQTSLSSSANVLTNANGEYELLLLTGSTTFSVQPASGSGLAAFSESNVSVTGTTTHDFTLPAAATLSGTVRGLGGAPVANANVNVYAAGNLLLFLGSAVTNAAGQYSIAATGPVNVSASGSLLPPAPGGGLPMPGAAPSSWNFGRNNVVVSGATTLDIDLPAVRVTGTATDSSGARVSNVRVQANNSRFEITTQTSLSSSANVLTNANGEYELLLLTGSTTFSVQPASGSGLAAFSESNVSVTGTTTHDFTLPAAATLSGTVRGLGGAPVANANVNVYAAGNLLLFLGSAVTNAAGQYSIAATGPVNVSASGSLLPPPPGGGLPMPGAAPSSWNFGRNNVVVSGATILNIDLPAVRVTGTATDSNGAPVPNVRVQANNSRFEIATQTSLSSSANVLTNANGEYELLLLTGSTTFSVTPPALSGFSPVSISGVALSGDLTQRIVLQHPDLSPPQIVAGPLVVHLSDTSVSISWNTNEPATSRVDYGVGTLANVVNDNVLTTRHAVTLLNLAPVSLYRFRAGSVDGSGNGPTFSVEGTFTTQAPPGDITPPVITDGPTVVFVSQTSAIVEWTTDEPATSSMDFGQTIVLGVNVSDSAGSFKQVHLITLIGLLPETTYFAKVTSADPDDNRTSSSAFAFTTLAVPDTTPPVITSGPAVVSKTDTQATLTWTTNEPATSGVSYNDGTHFDVVSDSALTKTHVMTLSGLMPQTAYSVIVSSTDAIGNGPTLSAPGTVTTDATPDTAPPVISNVQVTDITTSSAVISWTTNEAANSRVSYGTSAGSPDGSVANVSSVNAHRLTLTGLLDGTRYYLTAGSIDAAGNPATSGEIDFTTIPVFVDTPPTAPGPITAPSAPTRAQAFTVSWGASTDDVGISTYELLRDGEVIASVPGDTTLVDQTGLSEGQYVYRVRAIDTAGHTALSSTATVIVDRTAPGLVVPANFSVDAVGASGTVTFSVSASDNVDTSVVGTCSPPSGSALPVGTTEIGCTANDVAGNVGAARFTVTVRDVTAPALSAPASVTAEAASASGAVVSFTATAVDLVDGAVAVICAPASSSMFPIGTTTVQCHASDASHNGASTTFGVTVRDTTSPALLSVTPSLAQLSPPNHQLVRLSFLPVASDAVGATCSIIGATSSEPDAGSVGGDVANDIRIVSPLQADLRAERDSKGTGRTYTVTVQCSDAAGNRSVTRAALVSVPKNQGK